MSNLHDELSSVLNRHCAENGSNTPDFILADYLMRCLYAFDHAVKRRSEWYGRSDKPARAATEHKDSPPAMTSRDMAKEADGSTLGGQITALSPQHPSADSKEFDGVSDGT